MSEINNITASQRARACLLGGAVGDALGYVVEFSSLEQIRARFGERGIVEPVFDHGQLAVSDDTQMTLFTLEALLDCGAVDMPGTIARIRLGYLDWLITQRGTLAGHSPIGQLVHTKPLQAQRAPGVTCLAALDLGGHGSPEDPINDSKGCGGVMRVAPVGLFPQRYDVNLSFEIGLRAAALTHTHPSGYLAAGAMAGIIRGLLDGTSLTAAVRAICVLLEQWRAHEETTAAIDSALSLGAANNMDHAHAVAKLGLGWVGEEALAIGIYAALCGRDFPEVLAIAVNHDGDSDSTGSIAGQLYGAWRGIDTLPGEWRRRLDVGEPLEILLARIE